MEWTPDYSVGIAEIDRQHKVLLEHFSIIEGQIRSGNSWSDLHLAIVRLRDFAECHFFAEETLMAMFAYPGADDHAKAHRSFFERLDTMEHKAIREDVAPELLHFLRYWLIDHILGADRDYGRTIAPSLPAPGTGA